MTTFMIGLVLGALSVGYVRLWRRVRVLEHFAEDRAALKRCLPQTKGLTMKIIGTIIVALALLCAAPAASVSASSPINERPTAKDAKRWLKQWCKVQPGWSKPRVKRAMGTPTKRWVDGWSWAAFGLHFNAFFDEDGRVRQLDVNELGMSARQLRKLTCALVR